MHTPTLHPALLVGAVTLYGCTCSPTIGQPADRLVRQCGHPSETFNHTTAVGRHEEWRYGDTFVGLLDGEVLYVLK